METLWAGRILTPKRPIATMCYWLGLLQPTAVTTTVGGGGSLESATSQIMPDGHAIQNERHATVEVADLLTPDTNAVPTGGLRHNP